jgi:hypothetical protein
MLGLAYSAFGLSVGGSFSATFHLHLEKTGLPPTVPSQCSDSKQKQRLRVQGWGQLLSGAILFTPTATPSNMKRLIFFQFLFFSK